MDNISVSFQNNSKKSCQRREPFLAARRGGTLYQGIRCTRGSCYQQQNQQQCRVVQCDAMVAMGSIFMVGMMSFIVRRVFRASWERFAPLILLHLCPGRCECSLTSLEGVPEGADSRVSMSCV